MALSGALIIRGGFLPGRLARESPKNAKSSGNADSPSSWHLDNSAFPVVCLLSQKERVEKGNGDDRRFSRVFLRLRGAKDTWQTVTKNTRNTKKKKRKRAASYVSAASSPSSASMTSLSPAMLRITCVGCAASGGAGVPAGFTHTDARSAAPTPPCGARETRKKSDKRRGGRVSGAFARDARTKRRDP